MFCMLKITLLCVLCSGTYFFKAAESCRNPESADLQTMWLKYLQEDEACHHSSMMNIPAFVTLNQMLGTAVAKTQCQQFVDCPGCEDNLQPGCAACSEYPENGVRDLCNNQESEHLESRSMCPWYYVTSYDMGRYPDHLTEARCCRVGDACSDYPSTNLTQCEPLINYIPILINTGKADEDEMCIYEGKQYGLPVGCVAAIRDSE